MGKTVGIGIGVAGASAAKRVFQLTPKVVLQIGTCGVYPGAEHQPSDVFIASQIHLVDHGVLSGTASFAAPMSTCLDTNAALNSALSECGSRIYQQPIASTLATTSDDEAAGAIRSATHAAAENLEAFAIAYACQLAEIPFASVLAASHMIGRRSHVDWQRFERPASMAAADVVLNWLARGAQGMPHVPQQ